MYGSRRPKVLVLAPPRGHSMDSVSHQSGADDPPWWNIWALFLFDERYNSRLAGKATALGRIGALRGPRRWTIHSSRFDASWVYLPTSFIYTTRNLGSRCQLTSFLFSLRLPENLFLTLLPYFVYGVCFSTITQWSHIQEECFEASLAATPPDFVRHQVASCVDYSHGNWIVSTISIFLNYQTCM